MLLIGLMGKSGSGKTLISNLLKERDNSLQVIDIDKIGHNSHKDLYVKTQLLKSFGKDIFDENGEVDRKKLSSIVFKDEQMMEKLCLATYEYMVRKIDKLISQSEITILDYALLPKTKYFNMCDVKVLVEATYEERSNRVILRDNISTEKYDEINSNSLDYSNLSFDYVIKNNKDINYLRKVVGEIYEKSIVSR
ncbi:MAG: dephospho-CoA kinase [Clostridiales bacterium]|nr:dephospho-CoA kinase [Clostridiales bacterium]